MTTIAEELLSVCEGLSDANDLGARLRELGLSATDIKTEKDKEGTVLVSFVDGGEKVHFAVDKDEDGHLFVTSDTGEHLDMSKYGDNPDNLDWLNADTISSILHHAEHPVDTKAPEAPAVEAPKAAKESYEQAYEAFLHVDSQGHSFRTNVVRRKRKVTPRMRAAWAKLSRFMKMEAAQHKGAFSPQAKARRAKAMKIRKQRGLMK
jgi:hypothetical protein